MSLVRYEKKDRIAYITLNRPEKLNALNPEIAKQLAEVWVDFREDERLWVAILSGAGRAFSVGADIEALGESAGRSLSETSPALLYTPAGETPIRLPKTGVPNRIASATAAAW